MNIQIKTCNDIHREEWGKLVAESATGTWFQTPNCYDFYASLPMEFNPFVMAVSDGVAMRGICVGYITVNKNSLKQMATARAIIIGGPALANDASEEEVAALMQQVRAKSEELGAIYVETRNFNDYSAYRDGFEKAGFVYEEHNNFHVSTETFKEVKTKGATTSETSDRQNEVKGEEVRADVDYAQVVNGLMGKGRIRDIKTSFRDGAVVIDHPTIEQVREYYQILKHLYTTKVKTPLFPLSFFEALYNHPDGRFILVGLPKNGICNMENGKCELEIIGGTVCVELKEKCLYEWFVAGRDGEWKSIFPSSVATYAGIRYAAEHNLPRFDMMGAGTPQEAYGVRDFKARFGGELVEHGRYKYICKPILYKLGELGVTILKHLK